MALRLNMIVKGFEAEFYIKAIDVKAQNKGNVFAVYGYFANEEAAINIENAISKDVINFVAISGTDIFAQTYAEIKKLEKFKDAINC